MVVFNHGPTIQAPTTLLVLRRLGGWLWLLCLVGGAITVVALDAQQMLDQYTSG